MEWKYLFYFIFNINFADSTFHTFLTKMCAVRTIYSYDLFQNDAKHNRRAV